MTTMTLVMLLGIASSFTLVISALSVHRKRLLMFGMATGAIVAIQYGLVGAWVGLTTLTIGLIWTAVTLLSLKRPWLGHWALVPVFILFHLIAFSLLNNWDEVGFVNFIPLLGGVGGVIAIFFKDVLYTKAILIGLGGMWLVYQFHTAVYGQMIGESLNIVANAAALITLVLARRKGIADEFIEDVDRHLIGVITTSIPVITKSIHIPHQYVRGAHPSSVLHARMVEEQEKVNAG